MIVGIFGHSCVGKTTVAWQVAANLSLPLRSCGDAVRAAAEELHVSIRDLPDEAHKEVDAKSVEWALRNGDGCILEGRFLDAVFAAAAVPIVLIELTATKPCRILRVRMRNGKSTFSGNDLDRLDNEDAAFRARMYGQHGLNAPLKAIETSSLSVGECVQRVQKLIQAAGPNFQI